MCILHSISHHGVTHRAEKAYGYGLFPGGSRRNHCVSANHGRTKVLVWLFCLDCTFHVCFKGFSSIFTGCWNKSTKYLKNSSFAPDQRMARVCKNENKLVETSSYKSIFERKIYFDIIVFYYKSIIIKVFIIKVLFPTKKFCINIWNLNSYGSRLIIRARYYSLHLPYLLSLVIHLDSVFQIYLPSLLDISFLNISYLYTTLFNRKF